MAIDKQISYIYLDPADTFLQWQGYTEDFDSAVISVADKIAEQYDLRTVGIGRSFFFDDSLVISNVGGGGGAINIYNSDGVLTGNRALTGGDFTLKMTALMQFLAQTTEGSKIDINENIVGLTSILATTLTSSQLDIVTDLITISGQEFARYDAVNGEIEIGDSIRILRSVAIEMIVDTLLRVSKIRSASSANTNMVFSTHGVTFNAQGGEASPVAKWFFESLAVGNAGSVTLQVNDFGTKLFKIQTNGRIETPLIPVYLDVVTAQADAGLVIGSLYRTTAGGVLPDSMVRIKI